MTQHTELDFSVLGLIARGGPLTAYAVRKEFASSLTPTWSSSAGSVYPAIRRLEASGFISPGVMMDRRGSQQLSVTDKGLEALRRWILARTDAMGRPSADPIRTRAQFMETLGSEERSQFVETCIQASVGTLQALEEQMGSAGQLGLGERVAAEGARAELNARIKWLIDLRESTAC